MFAIAFQGENRNVCLKLKLCAIFSAWKYQENTLTSSKSCQIDIDVLFE